jgi:thiamine biosynthesis lipoprotein
MSPCWASLLLLAAGGLPGEPAATQARRFLMGTSIAVEAVGADAATRAAAIEEAYAAFAEVDRLMSNYRDDSELARVNRLAASEPVTVSDPLMAVLEAAQEVSRRSDGAFAVTVGPLVRLWGFHDKRPHLPTPEELARVGPLVGYENLILDRARLTVRFARPGVEIDLGGIAKGFAVELAAGSLKRRGLSGLIDAGGNQYLLGRPPGKAAWRVGIQHPDQQGKLLGVLEASEGSVSTSGAYATFLVADGRRYGHILDPRTLRPAEAAISVTVVSADATLADALSKVAFVLGPERGLKVVESFPGCSAVIAYRTPAGGIALTLSAALRKLFSRDEAVAPRP